MRVCPRLASGRGVVHAASSHHGELGLANLVQVLGALHERSGCRVSGGESGPQKVGTCQDPPLEAPPFTRGAVARERRCDAATARGARVHVGGVLASARTERRVVRKRSAFLHEAGRQDMLGGLRLHVDGAEPLNDGGLARGRARDGRDRAGHLTDRVGHLDLEVGNCAVRPPTRSPDAHRGRRSGRVPRARAQAAPWHALWPGWMYSVTTLLRLTYMPWTRSNCCERRARTRACAAAPTPRAHVGVR